MRSAWAVIAIVCGASATAAQPVDTDARVFAQRHFEQGVTLYDTRDLEGALTAFRTSYQLHESPNSLLYIARTLRELGRTAEAVEAFDAVIHFARLRSAEDERYAETAAAAEHERGPLTARVGWVVLRLDAPLRDGASVEVQGRSIPVAAIGLPIPVEPGEVVIRAGETEERRTIDRGVELEVRIRAPREPSPEPPEVAPELEAAHAGDAVPPPSRSPGLLVGVTLSSLVAVAGWVGLAVFGTKADTRFGELEEECRGGPCPDERQDEIEQGRRLDRIANASLAVGVAGTVTFGVMLGLLLRPRGDARLSTRWSSILVRF